ncbi:hypothetical protein ACFQY3_11460 [Paenibacillus farraposensis]
MVIKTDQAGNNKAWQTNENLSQTLLKARLEENGTERRSEQL